MSTSIPIPASTSTCTSLSYQSGIDGFQTIGNNNNNPLTSRAFMTKADKYQSLHHLTTLPPSIEKWKTQAFSIKNIEEALQFKIQQHTSRDCDRFRQVLRIFKEQAVRGDDEDAPVLGITRAQFSTVLALLGLYATAEQANMLFDKYDKNGDGRLTVHEFLTRNRPRDYVGERWQEPLYIDENRTRGKKQFLRRKLIGVQDPVEIPNDTIFHLTVERICDALRKKMTMQAAVGATFSRPRARRELAKHFEYYDNSGTGHCSLAGFERVLHALNFHLGADHLNLLMSRYSADNPNEINYVKFIDEVYPEQSTSTSLHLTNDHAEAMLAQREQEIKIMRDTMRAQTAPTSAQPHAFTTSLRPGTGSGLGSGSGLVSSTVRPVTPGFRQSRDGSIIPPTGPLSARAAFRPATGSQTARGSGPTTVLQPTYPDATAYSGRGSQGYPPVTNRPARFAPGHSAFW